MAKKINIEIEVNATAVDSEATLEVGAENCQVNVTPGLTVEAAFKRCKDQLGFSPGGAVTYSEGGETIPSNRQIVAGRTYTARASHEQKGR